MAERLDPLAARRQELERRLAALSPEARESVERSFAQGSSLAPGGSGQGIRAIARGGPLAMSFAQELLWLLEQNNPGHTYNVPRVMRLHGVLRVDALQAAVDALVARHEILRTTYTMVDGEPRQRIQPPHRVAIELVNLRPVDPAQREAIAAREVVERSQRAFDLSRDLQLRVTVIRMSDADQLLLLESHHIASDAWSGNILARELGALYASAVADTPSELPPLPLQYADFAAWQRERLSGAPLESLLGYWRTQLAGSPALLELPTDRPRLVAVSSEGGMVVRSLPSALLEELRQVSQRHNVTLFMTLLAAFDVLLSRSSGQDDIVVGSPMAGRTAGDTAGIVGYFVNMLVLRVSLEGNPTFAELLARVRESVLGAYDHQELPFEKLVMDLSREKVIGRGSPFQVMFTLQDPEREGVSLPGIERVPYATRRGATKFDLSLFATEREDGLQLSAEYRTDLFDAATVERMLAQLQQLLEGVARDTGTSTAALPLLDDREHARLLARGTGPTMLDAPARSLGALLTEQALATPDAIAVEIANADGRIERVTYCELHERAAALATRMVQRGVGPGVGVAICAERSLELVVAIVAVLRAGGFYIPLDPEYPADRVAFMFADAAPRVLLTTTALFERLRPALTADVGTGAPTVLLLDRDEGSPIDAVTAQPPEPSPEDLAYVIYTSGSTGRPKGVMIPNRAVVNYVRWMQHEYPLTADDSVLQKAPASFDACIWEFFLPLTTGARLVLARPGGHQDPQYLLAAIEQHQLSTLQLVPSQLAMMLEVSEALATARLGSLRHLFLGGEALPPELLARLRTLCPDLLITNLYGPTETTVYSSHWDCPAGSWSGSEVPIGRAIANTRIYLLDTQLAIVPDGVAGELCIGGSGVARGYLNRAELTAEKFVTDPFASGAATLMYRTGDRARWRPDGTLQYLGRIDTQVKLRGYRIELGEIEQALVQEPEVQSAVVMVRELSPGDQRLVAYCLPTGEMVAGSALAELVLALRERLRSGLPEYMIPSAIVWLDRWPMNANGKLDRSALPLPLTDDIPTGAAYIPPTTATEQLLVDIVQDVLKHGHVGVSDNFFELGGHSLLAMRVLSRVADRTGARVPLASFFAAPTLQALAATIDHTRAHAAPDAPRIVAAPRSAFRRSTSAGGS